MSPLRRLLHLLLALAVMANGAGTALASAHGCCAQMQQAAIAAASAASQSCHDHGDTATPAGHPSGHAGTPAHEDGCGHDHAGATCGCACTLQATTLLPTLPSLALAPMRSPTIAFAAHSRAAPPLPHPLRPPIQAG